MEQKDLGCAFLILQSNWNVALWEDGGKVWVTVKHHNCQHATLHGEIAVREIDYSGNPVLDMPEGFEVKSISKRFIVVSYSGNITAHFIAPLQEFSNVHKKKITSLDVSTGGGLGVSASTDESLVVWDTTTGSIRRTLEGHLGDVNCCCFFPSGMVVLSGGMDTQLKIWSAEDGYCARTLVGSHKAGILCVAMLERGRNVLSCSRDGSVVLWDCGSGSCLDVITSERSEVNDCDVIELQDGLFEDESCRVANELEVGTKRKLLVIACENGKLEGLRLADRKPMFSIEHKQALNCCKFIDQTTVVAGSQDGAVLVVDVRQTSVPMLVLKWCDSPIHSVYPSHNMPAFWISSGNGRCALFKLKPGSGDGKSPAESVELICELSGSDCDPVYKVVESRDNHVYTVCRDAVVRKYSLSSL